VAYSDQADVEFAAGGAGRLAQLADWDEDTAVDASAIAAAIATADALIDSFATKHFTVPFSPVPETIRRVSARLAKWELVRSRRPLTDPEQREWDRDAGTQKGNEGWLLLLAQGVVTPGGDPLPTKHSTMAPDEAVSTLPSDRDASRDKLGGFW
jgi:phage gp36-like protein